MATTITSTRTLAVNSAFMQEIKDGNPNLTKAIHQLQRACSSEEDLSQLSRRLTKALNALRVELALQFALEEAYGYIEVSDSLLEDLSVAAHNTKAEHNVLYGGISELVEAAEELQYRGVEAEDELRGLIDKTCRFSRQLRDHEQAENDLIDQSFDLG